MPTRDYTELDRIYARIPKIQCQRKCQAFCGPVRLSEGEADRLQNITTRVDGTCTLLTVFGSCAKYEKRPSICRLWGVTENLPCPHGCLPERVLSVQEGREIMLAIQAWSGGDLVEGAVTEER